MDKPGCGVCNKCGEIIQCEECAPENPRKIESETSFAGLNSEENREYLRLATLSLGEMSQDEFDYLNFLNKRVIAELLNRCRDDS